MAQPAPIRPSLPRASSPAPQARRVAARTDLVVTLGITLLAVVGVATVFGEPMLAAIFPPAETAEPGARTRTRAPGPGVAP